MQIDPDVLTPLADRFLGDAGLTPAERAEVLRIAQAFACKDSAAAARISPETIRARRKCIYRKLRMRGAHELTSMLLAYSLRLLIQGERLQAGAAAAAPGRGSEPSVARM